MYDSYIPEPCRHSSSVPGDSILWYGCKLQLSCHTSDRWNVPRLSNHAPYIQNRLVISYNTAVCNSLQSCGPGMPLPSSPEASLRGNHEIQFPKYTVSEAHPGYPVHQKYLNWIQPEDENCWCNTVYLPYFLLYGCPASVCGHALPDDMRLTLPELPPD